MSVDEIVTEIDKATLPDVMTKKEALEFLEEIQAELDGRVESLRSEIAEGG